MAKRILPQSDKPRKDIDEMSRAELRAYIEELKVRRDELLAQRAKRPEPATVSHSITSQTKLPTKRMTKRMTVFDAMPDAEQVDSLKKMWV